MAIDFSGLAARLLASADTVVPGWFPNGKRRGSEWVVGSLQGDPGDSLSINLRTGVWMDFATGDKGADLINLYAGMRGIAQGEAAKELGAQHVNGHHHAVTPMLRLPKPEREAAIDAPLQRPPADAPPPGRHRSHGEPVALYRYADADGTLGYVARYEPPGERKQFSPWIWAGGKWVAKAFPKPRPLYGLDRLAKAPAGATVMLCEGEKACDAAAALVLPQVLMTWPGGAKAVEHVDWSPLKGRTVNLWPDNDEPGRECMARVAEKLIALGCSGRVVDPTGESEGWDLADAVADGWDRETLKAWLKRDGGAHVIPYPSPMPEGDAATATPSAGPNRSTTSPSALAPPPAAAPVDAARLDKRQLWEVIGLDTRATSNGEPPCNEDTVLRILAWHPPKFWFDEFLQRPMCQDGETVRPMRDGDYTAFLTYCQRSLYLHKLTLSKVQAAVDLYVQSHVRNCAQDWLRSLQWDGIARLDAWLPRVFGTPADAYHMAVGRCFLLSMVARVLRPGCQCDYMPVFEGGQGLGKSTVCRILGGDWFTEASESPFSKDFSQCMTGKMLIEVSELEPFSRAGAERVKAVISNRVDTYRPPYGRQAKDFPRMCVLVGTTNRTDWVKDETGARRFWRVVTGELDIEYLREHRAQLFAEAVQRFQAGECYWDVPTEAARQMADEARAVDPWHDAIMSYANARQAVGVRIEDVLSEAVNVPLDRQSATDSSRVRSILTLEGWHTSVKKEHGRAVRRWLPGERAGRPSVPQVDDGRPDVDAWAEYDRTLGGR